MKTLQRFFDWLFGIPPHRPRQCMYCGHDYVGNFWQVYPVCDGVQPKMLAPLCAEHRDMVMAGNKELIEAGLASDPYADQEQP